jgi:hypothetical protein
MAWETLEPPISLKQGGQYACALHLGFFESKMATDELVAQKFTDAGFVSVQPDLKNMRVTGTWGQPDQDGVTLPSEVSEVWQWQP